MHLSSAQLTRVCGGDMKLPERPQEAGWGTPAGCKWAATTAPVIAGWANQRLRQAGQLNFGGDPTKYQNALDEAGKASTFHAALADELVHCTTQWPVEKK